jgi:hypothetical protein
MNRKLLLALLIIPAIFLLALASVALADDLITEEDPTENWCYKGGPWGDGRCSASTNPDVREWYWTCGWWRAQVFHNGAPWQNAPEPCRVELRLIAQEFIDSDIVTPPDDDEEGEEEPEPVPGVDIPVGTADVNIDWCTAEAGNNITIIGLTVSNYSSTTSNIGDVSKYDLISSNNGTLSGHLEDRGDDDPATFILFLTGTYTSFDDLVVNLRDGGNWFLVSDTIGTRSCDQNP